MYKQSSPSATSIDTGVDAGCECGCMPVLCVGFEAYIPITYAAHTPRESACCDDGFFIPVVACGKFAAGVCVCFVCPLIICLSVVVPCQKVT